MMKLICRGYSKQAIADELGVHRTNIVRDYKEVMKEVLAEQTLNTKRHIRKVLAQIAEVKKEAYEQWDRSKQPKTSRRSETSDLGSKESETVEEQLGDPRYLQIILNCLVQERDLLALDRPRDTGAGAVFGAFDWDQLARDAANAPRDVVEAKLIAVLNNPPAPPTSSNGNGASHD